MAQVKSHLALPHLVLLKIIQQHPNLHKHELWHPRGGRWNKSLKLLVESGHCAYVTADRNFAAAIDTLRFCGLLQEECPYVATEAAETLLMNLPRSEKKWPLLIKICDNGSFNLSDAIYFENK